MSEHHHHDHHKHHRREEEQFYNSPLGEQFYGGPQPGYPNVNPGYFQEPHGGPRHPGYFEQPYGGPAPPSAYVPAYPQQGPYGNSFVPSQPYAPPTGYGYEWPGNTSSYSTATYVEEERLEAANRAHAAERSHKRNEHLAELGALGAGAFALYEAHEVKVDPANARRHKIEEQVAEAAALGSGGFALYEHRQVRKDHKIEAEAYSEQHRHKHHGFFK